MNIMVSLHPFSNAAQLQLCNPLWLSGNWLLRGSGTIDLYFVETGSGKLA